MPERPWQEVILSQVEHSRANSRASRRSTALNWPPSLFPHVLAAARERDMSMAAYQRRSVLAFAEHDTGFDWVEEMKAEPAIQAFGGSGVTRELNGLGCGYWRIIQLGEHRA